MRYHYKKPEICFPTYGRIYICNHPVYSRCTLFEIDERGLAVIQQRYDPATKYTWWGEIDDYLRNDLYLNKGFKRYFDERADKIKDSLYPTVTIRQIMWALKMKPIQRERWETCFDRRDI